MAKPTSINFPGERKLDLKIQAAKRGTTMEKLIVDAFDAYVSRQPQKEGSDSIALSDITRYHLPHIKGSAEKISAVINTLSDVVKELLSEAEVVPGGERETEEYEQLMRNNGAIVEDKSRSVVKGEGKLQRSPKLVKKDGTGDDKKASGGRA